MKLSRPRSCARLAFARELALDDHLRRDAGVVGAASATACRSRACGGSAISASMQRVLERVAHVQRAGDVRRRQQDAVRLAVAARREHAAGFPLGVPLRLEGFRDRKSFPWVKFACARMATKRA